MVRGRGPHWHIGQSAGMAGSGHIVGSKGRDDWILSSVSARYKLNAVENSFFYKLETHMVKSRYLYSPMKHSRTLWRTNEKDLKVVTSLFVLW